MGLVFNRARALIKMTKILHVGTSDPMINPFVGFVKNNFNYEDHLFYLKAEGKEGDLKEDNNVVFFRDSFLSKIKYFLLMAAGLNKSERVIIHGLHDSKLLILLFIMPWLLRKCYWIMWGGDLYVYQLGEHNWKWKLREFFRRPVIKNIGYLVTYIKGDYELAQQWYGAKGQYQECFMYSSNLYKDYQVTDRQHTGINILIGNSADPTNNHLEILEKLEMYKGQDIKIYAPLSYGNPDHAKLVMEKGKDSFGDKFIPLTEMMLFKDYLAFLGLIDIAIFNHKRQQAMGNTITLLGLGKKVYMRSDVTQWSFFREHGIEVFDIENVSLIALEHEKAQNNMEYIKFFFSINNYKQQLDRIFN